MKTLPFDKIMWFPGRQISMQQLQGWPAPYLRGIYVVHWAGEDVDGAVSWQGIAAVDDVKWKDKRFCKKMVEESVLKL